MTAALEGVRVLVVEDEYLVAVLIQDMLESSAGLRLDESVLRIRGGRIDIPRCRHDIVVACQNYRHASPVEFQGMATQPH